MEAGFQSAQSQISFSRRGENMEQPSLLLQLSSSRHQLNIAADSTGEEQEGREGVDLGSGEEAAKVMEARRRRKDEEEEGAKEEESDEAFSSRPEPRIEVFKERKTN